MSNLDIDKFKSNFDNGARTNRFEVDFYCTNLGLNWEGLRVESCSLPGRQLETSQFSEYGPIRNLPFQTAYDGGQVDFTFLCDSSFADRFLIEAWMDEIISGNASTTTEGDVEEGPSNNIVASGNRAKPTYSYYNNYIGEVIIKQLRQNGKGALEYRLFEAYPVAFAPMELNSTSTDSIMRFTCTIAFRTFSTRYVEDPSAGSLINKGRKILDILLEGGKLADRFGKGNSFNDRLNKLDERLSRIGSIFG
jgi:hypothetical protein